jgi:hypothetical protein
MDNEVDQLRSEMISAASHKTYILSICSFLLFLYRDDELRHVLNSSFTDYINSHSALNSSQLKKKVKEYLMQVPIPETIDFQVLSERHFIQFVLSLSNSTGGKPSFATYNIHRSGFNHLFRIYRMQKPLVVETELQIYFKSLKRRHQTEIQNGNNSAEVGKRPLSFELYKCMAIQYLQSAGSDAIFGHTFMVLTWKLMCRASNTTTITYSHIEWVNDAMVVEFSQAKNDQLGEHQHPKHIYANPIIPAICPILSLGLYLMIRESNTEQNNLFAGNGQYDRFRLLQRRLCTDAGFPEILLSHGTDYTKIGIHYLTNIGTHSIRKGAASYTSSGSTACPSQSAINLRAGWSQGTIHNIYLRYQAGGDQYVGRTVSGLPRLSTNFAILPPQFRSDLSTAFLNHALDCCFPGLPISMRLVARFLLASVVYHKDFLRHTLNRNHAIFASPLFRLPGKVDDLIERYVG